MIKEKKFKKMTWKEFLKKSKFKNWRIIVVFDEYPEIEHYEIEKFDTKYILDLDEVRYDKNLKVVVWNFPAEIIDWDNNVEFYLVYFWNRKEGDYIAYEKCFFSKKEIEKFLNKRRRGKNENNR